MNKIIFCDKNKELLKKVKTLFEDKSTINNTHCKLIVDLSEDVLKCKKKYPNAKIITASNPDFSMSGGLDLVIKNKYPEQCKTPREFKFTEDLFFVISVDNTLKSTTELVKRALLGAYFCSRKFDIILTGLGTGIGGLSSEDFIKELALFVSANFSNTNFNSADFSSADFRWADFRWADFSSTNFKWADFRWADFRWADFSRADFRWADFSNTNFSGANFRLADFRWADFSNTNFSSADFSRANFSGADFSNTNFSSADFSSADFRLADFSNTNFSGTKFRWANFSSADFNKTSFNYRLVPDEGVIIVWKKAGDYIIKLEVDCKNISGGLISRKLRTDKAKVLEIQNIDGSKSGLKSISSNYSKSFVYEVGKTVRVNNFVKNDRIECDSGIHFFITRDEAVRW